MRFLVLSLLFILSSNYSFSQFITVFADTNDVHQDLYLGANYDAMNASLITKAIEWDKEKQTYVRFSGNLLSTSNAGISWDTLNKWALSETESVNMWEVKLLFYFDVNTLAVLYKTGDLVRYHLKSNKIDTMKMFTKEILDKTGVMYYSRIDDSSAIITSFYEDGEYISTDAGDTWIKIPRTALSDSPYASVPGFSTILPKSKDIFQLYVWGISQYNGFIINNYILSGNLYSHNDSLWSVKYIGKYADLRYATFINDSIGFIPGIKVYYSNEGLSPDSVFSKPLVYKTTNGGKDWELSMESPTFCGNPNWRIFNSGDTLILTYLRRIDTLDAQSLGYFISTDLGNTWTQKDLSHLKPKNVEIRAFYFVSTDESYFSLRTVGKRFTSLDRYKFTNVSVQENPLFTSNANFYPNPANDFVSIDLSNIYELPTKIEIFDIFGSKVQGLDSYKTIGNIMINTSNLSSGTYSAMITFGEQSIVKRFVVNR